MRRNLINIQLIHNETARILRFSEASALYGMSGIRVNEAGRMK